MEFLVNAIKIGSTVVALIMVLSIVSMFFKRYRKIGLISMIATILVLIILCAYYFIPRSYERHYLSQRSEFDQISLSQSATKAGIYLGTTGNVPNISKNEITKSFNSITPENALKMGRLFHNQVVGQYDFSHADSMVDFAISNNLRVRGHTLVWGKLSSMFKDPDLDVFLDDFPEAERAKVLKDLVDKHIRTVLTHYKGKIFQWDVVNEPLEITGRGEFEENVYYRYLGENYLADAFRLAYQLDPGLKLFLNEILFNYHDERAEGFYKLVKRLKQQGVPIHGVGFQSHVLFSIPSPDNLKSYIKKFTELGLEVELTEVDARLRLFNKARDPYKAQAEFYGQLLQVCLESPGCTGITFWGLSDDVSWMEGQMIFAKPNEPYFYDHNLNPKPVIGELDRVFKQHGAN